MEYTKSEVRKLKKLIDEDILKLEHYTKLYIPDPLTGLADLCIADFAVTELDAHLKCIKEHIENTDNFDLAVEIEGKVTPVWGKYVEKVTTKMRYKDWELCPVIFILAVSGTQCWIGWIGLMNTRQNTQSSRTHPPPAHQRKKMKSVLLSMTKS